MRAGPLISVVGVLVAGPGCGVGSNDACGRILPCGGDLTGNWTVVAGCADPSVAATALAGINSYCSGDTVDAVTTSQMGTFTFAADLAFTAHASSDGAFATTLPADCLGGLTCPAISNYFMMRGLTAEPCTGTSSCSCPIVRPGLSIDGGGTYTVDGTMLTLVSPSGAFVQRQYCVAGSTMHLMIASSTTVDDDIVLAKQ